MTVKKPVISQIQRYNEDGEPIDALPIGARAEDVFVELIDKTTNTIDNLTVQNFAEYVNDFFDEGDFIFYSNEDNEPDSENVKVWFDITDREIEPITIGFLFLGDDAWVKDVVPGEVFQDITGYPKRRIVIPDYNFLGALSGWTTTQGGTTVEYIPGRSYILQESDVIDNPQRTIYLYPIWNNNQTFTVNYKGIKTTSEEPFTVSIWVSNEERSEEEWTWGQLSRISSSSDFKDPYSIEEGLTFIGWRLDSNFDNIYADSAQITGINIKKKIIENGTGKFDIYALEVAPTDGDAYAIIQNNELIFFRSFNTYQDDAQQNVVDILNKEYNGIVFTGIEDLDPPLSWLNHTDIIKSVKVADDQIIFPQDCAMWFFECTEMEICNLQHFNTSNVRNMFDMFEWCTSLESLDLSSFDTSNVTTINGMFYGCNSLISLNLSNFNTSNVTDMSTMFTGCSSLTSLDLSNFNTSNVTNMSYMFNGCSSLTSLDLSNFDTSNVEDMRRMFYQCSNLERLMLSNFTIESTDNITEMFSNCTSLLTIYCDSNWNQEDIINDDNMFDGCDALIGGAGTEWDSNYVDVAYAHPDGGTENPGYFTSTEQWGKLGNAYAILTNEEELIFFRSFEEYINGETGTVTDVFNNSYTGIVYVISESEG